MAKKKSPKSSPPPKEPEAFAGITDPRKRKAATLLAYNGYHKGKKARTGAVTHAARAAGVSVQTLYVWLEKDEEFVTAIEEIKHELRSEAIHGIRTAAKNTNPVACMMQLKILSPEEFDDQMIRDRAREEAKRKHELDMFRLKCAHEKEMLELRIKGGLPAEDREMPDFSFEETGPGERRHKDDAVH